MSVEHELTANNILNEINNIIWDDNDNYTILKRYYYLLSM